MGKVVGIDLGTTNSVVAIYENGQVTVIPNQEGKRTTPSIVAWAKGETLVGELAKRQMLVNPKGTIFSSKRFIGRSCGEVDFNPPYEVGCNNGRPVFKVDGNEYFPQQIGALILQKLKKAAEDYIGDKVTGAVITVPAYFNDAQRKATKEAGEIAGLEVLRIVNEPTAAAIAFGADKKKEGKVVVFDLGGGTFDVSILDIADGVFEVLATSGDNYLGGDDFDKKIVDFVLAEIKNVHGIDLSNNSVALARIREAAEQAKIELSSQMSADINLPYIAVHNGEPLSVNITLTRAKFESLCSDLFERIKRPCYQALEAAKIDKVDMVLLVGGSTRIPRVQQIAEEIFGVKPSKEVNPDEAVAVGAAIYAASIAGNETQSATSILLLDVIPISLGVETYGNVFEKIVEANTTIPTKKSQIFTTAADNQTTVEIHVLQGERPIASENKSLGRFYLSGIPPAPRGVPQIEVTFDIDVNGILTVSAKELRTGKEQSIRIEGASNLSKDEVERMKQEAKTYEQKDKEFVEKAKELNRLDMNLYSYESFLNNTTDLSDEDKEELRKHITELKTHIQNKDLDNAKISDFKIGEIMKRYYERRAQAQQPAEETTTSA